MRLSPPESNRGRALLALAVIAAIAFLLFRDSIPFPDLEQILEDLSTSLGKWTYLLVGAFAFLETGAFVGLVAPGETAVVVGGAVAGQGETSVWLTLAIVWVAAYGGDTVSFYIGRRLGRDFIIRHGHRVRITRERFKQVEDYFERHGGKTILIGRFLGLIRALAPFVAGSSGMAYRAMAPYSVLGTGLWAATFTILGYVASRNIAQVTEIAGRAIFLTAAVIAMIVAGVYAVRRLRDPEKRRRAKAWMRERRAGRVALAAGGRVEPQLRFVWDRLTPGGLGIELTSLLAAVAVAGFVFVAYADILSGMPGPTSGDGTAIELARDLEAGWLTDLAEVVTWLGGGGPVIAVALAAALALLWGRKWPELATLVVSMTAILIAVPELKDAIDRPRPSDPLVEVGAGAYPSGHAAYSVLYAWLAITLTIRLRPGLRGGAAILVAGLLLTAAIGLSRVYLRVHWLSDVSGGWGLAVAIFALVGAVALTVSRLRQNGGGDGSAAAGDSS